MIDKLKRFFERVGRSADAQQQREAMLDLLVWTMYADNVLTLPENDRIDQIAADLEWNSPDRPSVYISKATSKIRDVLSDPERADQLLEDIHRRLGTASMRKEAYDACYDLAQADGQLAAAEMKLLQTVRERFGIKS